MLHIHSRAEWTWMQRRTKCDATADSYKKRESLKHVSKHIKQLNSLKWYKPQHNKEEKRKEETDTLKETSQQRNDEHESKETGLKKCNERQARIQRRPKHPKLFRLPASLLPYLNFPKAPPPFTYSRLLIGRTNGSYAHINKHSAA